MLASSLAIGCREKGEEDNQYIEDQGKGGGKEGGGLTGDGKVRRGKEFDSDGHYNR